MRVYRVEISEFALKDLEEAKKFYAATLPELGGYFIDTLLTDIESLAFYGGIHQKVEGLYRLLSRRFPYGIYYRNHLEREGTGGSGFGSEAGSEEKCTSS